MEVEHKIAATVFESQEGMIITDASSVILRANQAFTRVTGYSAEEVVGRNPRLLRSGLHGGEFYQAIWGSINNTGAWEGEIWNRRKSGEIYPEQLTITAVKDVTGTVTNYVATFLDITKRKQAEQEVLEAKEVAEQALSEQSRFVSMLTHELRTPLSVLRMSLSLIEPKASLKQHINQALDDMSGIIERSSQVDLFEKRRLIARKESCQLDHILDAVVSSSLAPSRIVIDLAPLPVLNSDIQLLRIVFSNLVANAIKYSAPNTDININAETAMLQSKLGVCIYIQNQPGASGLPDPDRLFHKYYRSPGASGTTGSGLGLYLVHSLVELVGGRITYEVVQDKVRFTLWIPC